MSKDQKINIYPKKYFVNGKRPSLKIKPQYDNIEEDIVEKRTPQYLEKYNGTIDEFEQYSYKVDISSLWIDDRLMINSKHPVENRVVTSAIIDLSSKLLGLSSEIHTEVSNISTFLSNDYSTKISSLEYNLNLSVQNICNSLTSINYALSNEISSLCVYFTEKIHETSSYLFERISDLCSYVEQLQNIFPISSFSDLEVSPIPLTRKVHLYEAINQSSNGKFPNFKAPTDITNEEFIRNGYIFDFEVEWKTMSNIRSGPTDDDIHYVWLNEMEIKDDNLEHTYCVKGRYDSRNNEILFFWWRTI